MKKKMNQQLISLALAGALTLMPVIGVNADTKVEVEEDSKSLPLQQLRIFAQIFGRIKQDYVEPVEDSELLENAIKGVL